MKPPLILVVDDQPQNLTLLCELLHGHFSVRTATSGRRALEIAGQVPRPDLILVDVMMPGMDGFQVLERLKSSAATQGIPVIFTSALVSLDDDARALSLGAADVLTKPLRAPTLLSRIRTHIELSRARARLGEIDATDAHPLDDRHLRNITLLSLARLAEARDHETGNHLHRTQAYVRRLGQELRHVAHLAPVLDERSIDLIARSAPLHDIGKVGIPDHVLHKPGPLTGHEQQVMRTHTRLGAEAIARAEADLTHPAQFLVFAKQIIAHHHERWDGSGYPDGLAGEQIPLPARLMALADVFDALISARVYKPAMPPEQARSIIVAGRGTQFDPEVVDAFEACFGEFCDIARRHADQAGAPQATRLAMMASAARPTTATPVA